MTIFTKRTAATALLIGAASITTACGGHGPNSYLMPKDAVIAKLADAEREFDYIGSQKRTIRSIAVNGDKVRVRLTSSTNGMKPANCNALVEAIDDEWTRVTPDCTDRSGAIDETVAQINEMQIDEFVIAVLYDRPVDADMVLRRTSAVAIDNLDEMSREARAASDAATNGSSSGSWGSEDGNDWGS
ncbi:hypothetical protein [uncultured Erythrobacter sp.]|uniref:hypothetical protein n=1 Tax=uncultured Erythrobacter sp. TaxID=263913 RepID=UPI00261BCA41|nr:hypothetical protein [uncultured Erythrobacter sp.]